MRKQTAISRRSVEVDELETRLLEKSANQRRHRRGDKKCGVDVPCASAAIAFAESPRTNVVFDSVMPAADSNCMDR